MHCVYVIFQNILLLIIWKKRTGLKGVAKLFSVNFNPIDANDILGIHKYLTKRIWYKIMFGWIKKNIYWISNWSS